MGRLFRKLFLSIWIAQVIGTMAVMLALKLEHGADKARAPEPNACAHGGMHGPPRPEPSFLPPEPLVAHMVASLVVASLLAHYFSRPIRSLRTAFQTAATGDLAVGIDPAVEKRDDELSDLLSEFDRMAKQLQVLMESQRRLLHDVSHEVRSPLARMQAAIGLARQQPQKTDYLLGRIEREISRIDRLVEELLTLARLEASETGAMDEDVRIDAILADIMDSAQFEAQANGKSFHMSGQCHAVVRGNRNLLHRAIENVVRNAILHTDDGTRVYLRTDMAPGMNAIMMSISDNGPGVPEARLGAIFEPFSRGGLADGDHEGHGLGLAIAAQIVKMHEATIRASNLPQGGLRVQIVIPVLRHDGSGAADHRETPS
jgi:two-component system, OmpR family, sensor kinase